MRTNVPYTAFQRRLVVARALEVVEARLRDETSFEAGGQVFTFEVGAGTSVRFVRQVFESALGLPAKSWPYSGATAKDLMAQLRAAGEEVDPEELRPGDILCHGEFLFGHAGLYVGRRRHSRDGRTFVAENTAWVGGDPIDPGTKLTPLKAFLSRAKAWRAFRLFPTE